MIVPPAGESLAQQCAGDIDEAFAAYNFHFRSVTQRARRRFETRDWHGAQRDAVQRIELYDRFVNKTVRHMQEKLGARARDRALWREIRGHYSGLIESYVDAAFTKTFFSSITRRVFGTVGVDADVEYLALDHDPVAGIDRCTATTLLETRGSLWKLFAAVVDQPRFGVPWVDRTADIDRIVAEVDRRCTKMGGHYSVKAVEFLKPVFYRDNRAYLVGRIHGSGYLLPIVIALANGPRGLYVDAIVASENDVSIIFGFARSYFHADLETVGDAVVFLRTLLPRKPISEIYTVLGRAKQGKTERFRDLVRHLETSADRFENAAFDRGMVMLVFTLPSYPVVFKIIRDRFAYPKTANRDDVIGRYRLVFKHDRVGRLVDAQEFRDLKFRRDRFDPALLDELLDEAADTCFIEDDHVVIRHLYIERRLTPLNRFIREADSPRARRVVLDYGQAIKDLAHSNIFAGDLLLKNFGVTRHDRVIFYDYDELCLLEECRFRDLPQARSHEDEMQSDTWFYVAENDVFPEQFLNFLGLEGDLARVFRDAHGDLLTARYWRDVQARLAAGQVIEILPFRPLPTTMRDAEAHTAEIGQ